MDATQRLILETLSLQSLMEKKSDLEQVAISEDVELLGKNLRALRGEENRLKERMTYDVEVLRNLHVELCSYEIIMYNVSISVIFRPNCQR